MPGCDRELRQRNRARRRRTYGIPSALADFNELWPAVRDRQLAVFLDYDGTLTPIVRRPGDAVLTTAMRTSLRALARQCPVAIISGRDRRDIEQLVHVRGVIYAGSHGFDIRGPRGLQFEHQDAKRYVPMLRRAGGDLRRRLAGVRGALIEAKPFVTAVHYRQVAPAHVAAVRRMVRHIAGRYPVLRVTGGKMILELRPRLKWNKGKAVLWLRRALHLDAPDAVSVYLGDDETDEDAFAALRDYGIGILVAARPRPTHARYRLATPEVVGVFLERLVGELSAGVRRRPPRDGTSCFRGAGAGRKVEEHSRVGNSIEARRQRRGAAETASRPRMRGGTS